ncbi:TetR/AcrR family transcriptional regulator [Chitinibacter sp. SCUT-21]|uniref:TetR/AcrR family transcriptional regulator n=1 Tax=Chitinibacter sp. SCUT-21 TaxID=2970891 RepID=UPI0035A6606A
MLYPDSSDHLSTQQLILARALDVFVEDGMAGFTTRKIAERAGIAVGNLTYHYPNKQGLLLALIEQLLTQYARQFASTLAQAAERQENALEALIRWVLEDASRERTVRLFRELWSVALHDASVRDSVDRFYDQIHEQAIALLQAYYPTVSEQTLREVTSLVAVSAEGCLVLYGTKQQRSIDLTQMMALVQRVCAQLIEANQA